MKHVIEFTLRRRFLNTTAIILNVVIFLGMGVLCHIDLILSDNKEKVYVGESEISEALLNGDEMYTQNEEEAGYVLYYEEGWKLECRGQEDKEVVYKVENDIRAIVSKRLLNNADLLEREFIEKYCQSVEVIKSEKSLIDINMIVVSAVFYLVLSYSNLIANELIYEKSSHTLELMLIAIGEKVHLISKIVTAYLSLAIQGMMILVSGIFWFIIRYNEDRLRGLITFLSKNAETDMISVDGGMIFMIIVLVLSALLLIQLIMLIITSLYTNSEETAVFQNVYYVLLIIRYYLFIINGNADLVNGTLTEILSYLPLTSMIFMSIRVLNGLADVLQILIATVINITVILILIRLYLPFYKRLLLRK